MPVVTKYATGADTAQGNASWSFPTRVSAEDDSEANFVTSRRVNHSEGWLIPAFTEVGLSDTINSITLEIRWRVSSSAGYTRTFSLGKTASHLQFSSGLTGGLNPTTATTESLAVTGASTSDIRAENGYLNARTIFNRDSSTASTVYIDFIRVTVDYTAAASSITTRAARAASRSTRPLLSQPSAGEVGTPKVGALATGTGTTTTVPYPAGVSATDLLLIGISARSPSEAFSASGWAEIFSQGGTFSRYTWLWKVAAAGDEVAADVTVTGPDVARSMKMIAVPGVDTTTPIDGISKYEGNDSTADPETVMPSQTPTVAGCMPVWGATGFLGSGTTWTSPDAGAIEVMDVWQETSTGNHRSGAFYYQTPLAGTGATGTRTADQSVSATSSGVYLLLRPAPASDGVTPAEVLNIGAGGTQNHFDLQTARSGDPDWTLITQAQIAAGFEESPIFVTTGTTPQRVQLYVQADAPTIAGQAPRSELREVNADGSNAAFDALTGTHEMHGRTTITHAPAAAPDIVFAQLHNGDVDRVTLRTQLVSGTVRGRLRVNGSSVHEWANPYVEGTEVEWRIRVVDGAVSVFINDMVTPAYTAPAGTLTATAGVTTWYFKTGSYLQTTSATVGAAEYGSVELRDLTVSHTAGAVDIVTRAARSSSRAGRPAVAQVSPLQVRAARAASRATRPLLAQVQPLIVDGARAASRAGRSLLAQSVALSVRPARASSSSGRALVGQVQPITTRGVRAATRAGRPLLAQVSPIVTAPAQSATRAVRPLLSQTLALVTFAARTATRTTRALVGQVTGLVTRPATTATRANRVTVGQVHPPLTVTPAAAATRATRPLLAQAMSLTVTGARADTSTTRALIGQAHQPLVTSSARSTATTGRALVGQSSTVAVGDARSHSRTSAVELAQTTTVTTRGARAASRTAVVFVDGSATLTVRPARTTTRAGAPRLAHAQTVTTRGARSVTSGTRPLVDASVTLTVHPSSSSTRAQTVGLAHTSPLTTRAAAAPVRVLGVTVDQTSTLTVYGARASSRATTATLATAYALTVPAARSATSATVTTLEQLGLLTTAGARAPTRAPATLLAHPNIAVAGPDQTLTIPADDRTVVVPAEDRTIVVPSDDRTVHVPVDDRTLTVPPNPRTTTS